MSAVTRSATASPSVSLHGAVDPSWFPLKSIGDVVQFFRRSLETNDPDLTLLSIVAGYVELSLTTGVAAQAATAAAAAAAASANEPLAVTSPSTLIAGNVFQTAISSDIIRGNIVPFPLVTHEAIAGLYKKFQSILSVIDKPKSHNRPVTREIIKKVSDIIWHSLIRSTYKDRAHLQNLYSYLSGNKLDSFGVALAVVAGCQLIGYRDVHLAVSEDHAWVVFGSSKRSETIEVTWHGKGSEDKRGQDISPGIDSRSWLYLLGQAVVCDRYMEVAAIVSAINISLTSSSDCVEVADLQQQLLWLLYDMGHLKRYPMALGSLGELEEINSTRRDVNCEQLYGESIAASRKYYNNHHVYPYTYQGNYYNRILKYRDAFAAWANAGDVIRLYTYQCRDDEEIYKELLDIANEIIPYVMKTESSGHSGRSILRDSEVFANLLRFYDGICQWEEDSLTPILHIGWAKPLVNNITKFDYDIRSQVVIKVPEDNSFIYNINNNNNNSNNNNNNINNYNSNKECKNKDRKHTNNIEGNNNTNHNNLIKKEEKSGTEVNKKQEMATTLADLTAACGEKILNPDFLLQGGGQPFAEQKQQTQAQLEINQIEKVVEQKHNDHQKAAAQRCSKRNGAEKAQLNELKAQNEVEFIKQEEEAQDKFKLKEEPQVVDDDPRAFILKRPIITLYSQKMKGLKDLLLAEKLNTHAISLQVTAQSVPSRKVRGVDKFGHHGTTTTTTTTASSSSATTTAATTNNHHNATDAANTNINASAAAIAASSDSIAASRPKRTRRE